MSGRIFFLRHDDHRARATNAVRNTQQSYGGIRAYGLSIERYDHRTLAGGNGEQLRAGTVRHQQSVAVRIQSNLHAASGSETVEDELHRRGLAGMHGAVPRHSLKTHSGDKAIDNHIV